MVYQMYLLRFIGIKFYIGSYYTLLCILLHFKYYTNSSHACSLKIIVQLAISNDKDKNTL